MIVQRIKNKIGRLWQKTRDQVFVPLLPSKYANLLQTSEVNLWSQYFVDAEPTMQGQWDNIIWPLIRDFNFDAVLELAPGGGRNTKKLCAVSKKIYAADYNAYAIEQCRKNLETSRHACDIEYHVNDGVSLHMIPDDTISAIYCWDAAVHFDQQVLQDYVREFARVLQPGGRGFIHHSNLGEAADKNIKINPGWRSNVSRASFADMCTANGLSIVAQIDIPWGEFADCGTVFEKPAA